LALPHSSFPPQPPQGRAADTPHLLSKRDVPALGRYPSRAGKGRIPIPTVPSTGENLKKCSVKSPSASLAGFGLSLARLVASLAGFDLSLAQLVAPLARLDSSVAGWAGSVAVASG
jgi:hypothetical protein